MPLEYDPHTSEIRYEGRVVGRYDCENGKGRVTLNITYECTPTEWVVPLSWFAFGLSHLAKHQHREKIAALTIQTDESEVAEEYQVLLLLTEKIVKHGGFVWEFHMTDDDNWPSALHAHDYDKNLKLDAITGEIYDSATRQRCKRLSAKELARIHATLRAAKDFAERAAALLPQ